MQRIIENIHVFPPGCAYKPCTHVRMNTITITITIQCYTTAIYAIHPDLISLTRITRLTRLTTCKNVIRPPQESPEAFSATLRHRARNTSRKQRSITCSLRPFVFTVRASRSMSREMPPVAPTVRRAAYVFAPCERDQVQVG